MKKYILPSIAAFIVAWVAVFAFGGAVFAADYPSNGAVRVEVEDGHGSGVYIGDGLILTASHVVNQDSSPWVIAPTGEKVTGRVVYIDTRFDIAMVEIVTTEAFEPFAKELACREPWVGEAVSVVGYPKDFAELTTFGRVSGMYQPDSRLTSRWEKVFVVDANVLPGNSGGPVYDLDGKVLGIAVGGLSQGFEALSITGYSFVVPSTIPCQYLAIT